MINAILLLDSLSVLLHVDLSCLSKCMPKNHVCTQMIVIFSRLREETGNRKTELALIATHESLDFHGRIGSSKCLEKRYHFNQQ